jgi:hypothetical protein
MQGDWSKAGLGDSVDGRQAGGWTRTLIPEACRQWVGGRAVLTTGINLRAAVHALPFRILQAFQANTQNGPAIVELLLDGRRERIDFMDNFSY